MFYERLKELCAQKNMTVTSFLKDIGLNTSKTTTWKTSMPNAKTIAVVAEYFNVSADYLLGNTDIKEKPNANNDDGLSDDKRFILAMLREMDPSLLPEAKRYLDYLIASRKKDSK